MLAHRRLEMLTGDYKKPQKPLDKRARLAPSPSPSPPGEGNGARLRVYKKKQKGAPVQTGALGDYRSEREQFRAANPLDKPTTQRALFDDAYLKRAAAARLRKLNDPRIRHVLTARCCLASDNIFRFNR